MTPKLQLSDETIAAIESIGSHNEDFIKAAMNLFVSDLLLPAEFSSSDIADVIIALGIPEPTDWRATGPLMRRAVAFGLIETTGDNDTRRSITGHTSNHLQPTYRIARKL